MILPIILIMKSAYDRKMLIISIKKVHWIVGVWWKSNDAEAIEIEKFYRVERMQYMYFKNV